MGQNDAMRPQGVSSNFGPLWCVPVTGGLAAVWGRFPDGCTLVGVVGSAGLLAPTEQHRIFSPGASQIFYILPSRGLQDGQPCRAVICDRAGVQSELALDLRLASWQVERVPQIISFIITRVLPKLGAASDHSPLERFLSLASSWRARSHASADLGSRAVYALDVAPRVASQTLACFFVSSRGLNREMVGCVASGDRTILVAPKEHPDRAYIDLGGDLIELDFSGGPISADQSVAWLRQVPSPTAHQLLDRLSAASALEGTSFPSYVASSLKTAVVPLAEPGAQLSVHSCLRTPDHLLLFLELTGTASLAAATVELFGAKAGSGRTPDALVHEHRTSGGLPRTRMVLKVAIEGDETPPACKLVAMIGDQSVQCWIQIQPAGGALGLDFAHEFWPLAARDGRYLADVLAPLARAWTRQPRREPSQILGLAAPGKAGALAADVQVVAGSDLDALHSTLLGLRSSIPAAQAVRAVLSSTIDPEQECRQICEWLHRYRLHAHVELLAPSVPPAAAALLAPRRRDQVSVAVRAGFIPPHAGWLDQITDDGLGCPGDAFIGIVPGHPLGSFGHGVRHAGGRAVDLSPEQVHQLLQDEAIVGIAASGHLIDRIRFDEPVCHTLIGAWAEWLLEVLGRGGRVRMHPALAFWDTKPQGASDHIGIRIDALALAHKLSTMEEAMVPAPVGVLPRAVRVKGEPIRRRRTKSLGQK